MEELTLIIPAKKESESLPIVIDELQELNQKFKIKIVLKEDDIETINSITHLQISIQKQTGLGYGNALIEGINSCSTKYFCIFNADGSFDPKEIYKMFNKFKNQNFDLIFGSRYLKGAGSDDDTFVTKFGNFIFTLLGNYLFKLNISDILYTFVIGSSEKVKKLKLSENDFAFCVELPIKAKLNKLNISDIECFERKRIAGKKKVNAIYDGLKILFAMIKFFFNK